MSEQTVSAAMLGNVALGLAARGMAIFPLRPRTKEPYNDDKFFRTVGGYKSATRDSALIEFWWSRQPEANIGLATGSVSACWVLDVDGDEGRETLATLEEEHGQLPATVEVITPGKIDKRTGVHTGKGLHLYFRYPLGRDIRNAQHRDDLPGLDWRGNGGYVAVPPSVHPDGGKYCWSVDSADTFADAPAWLLELVISKRRDGAVNTIEAKTPEWWRAFIKTPDEASKRADGVKRLAGLLLRTIDPYVALDICRMFNTERCRPPLSDIDVVKIVDAISHLQADNREGKR
jgi:hypothetical protein